MATPVKDGPASRESPLRADSTVGGTDGEGGGAEGGTGGGGTGGGAAGGRAGGRSLSARLWDLQVPSLRPHLPVVALMVAYTVYFSRLSIEIYRGYGSPGFDLGIFDQGVWLLSRFKAPFVTVMGRNLFGDHTSLILLLLVPVYWIYPHVTVLLVIQSALLALGALPVYLLARDRLHNDTLATLLAAAFLLHPALQWGNLEQFHPECFLIPLVGLAMYAAVTWKPWLLILTVGMCLLVKEDVALFVVPLGIWVAFRRDRVFGWKMVGAGVAAAVLLTEGLIRGLTGVPSIYTNRIPFGGLGHFYHTILRKPGTVFDYLLSDRRPFYVWQMAFPSALIFGRAPEVALIGLLLLASNLVSNFPYQHQILFHYSLATIPILAMGTVFAIGSLKKEVLQKIAVVAVALCSLYACFLWGALPAISVHKVPHWKPSNAHVHDINTVLAALPPNAVVSAHYSFIAHLDHRDRAYQWPDPFRASNWGLLNQEGQRLAISDQVEYLFLQVQESPEDQKTFDQIRSQFDVVRQVGNVILLRRSRPA